MVLNGARHNFTGRSRSFVDQYGELAFFEKPAARCLEIAAGLGAALGIGDEFASGQKLIGQANGSIQITTRIAAQIEHQGFYSTLLLEFEESFAEFIGGGGAEFVDFDVAGGGIEQIGHIHTVNRNTITGNGECQELGLSVPLYRYLYLAAFFATQFFNYIVVADVDAGHVFTIYFDDFIASADAHLF